MDTKVLMVLNNHYTHDPRVTAEAESLVKHGYEVKVIAWDKKKKYPLHEIINGVEVIRIRIPKILDELIPFEILKVPIWQALAYKKAVELYRTWKFQIVHVHDWPDLPVGVKLKQKFEGIFLIYDSHEVWNYMIFTNKLPEFLWEVIWRERKMLRHVDVLITVGKGYKRYFLRYMGDVKIILNAKPIEQWKRPRTKPLTVVYIGGFNKFRCIKELAIVLCKVKYPTIAIIAGPEDPKYKMLFEKAKDCGLRYFGHIPKSQVIPLTRDSIVVYYVFDCKNPLYKIGMPNKLFEAIATGRASLAGKGTLSGKFVEEYKIGLSVDCDVIDIQNALIYLYETPKFVVKFGRRAYSIGKVYNWSLEEQKLLRIYGSLTSDGSGGDKE
ncbi:glycosyltransferase [Thermococcus sp. SY098]|uniref:glycosyltransferase n=1 Tax=Thermococcus sp. SY098 TaxID=3111325 RepID=UPI002D78A7E2|nr:glycosyltransferase [Thermococcus sp. SY098]WRS51981.1 glycosyltransferase [Thermococcus sp. SY098]